MIFCVRDLGRELHWLMLRAVLAIRSALFKRPHTG
jgi:hypothetical protein